MAGPKVMILVRAVLGLSLLVSAAEAFVAERPTAFVSLAPQQYRRQDATSAVLPESRRIAAAAPVPTPFKPLFMGWGPEPVWSEGATVESNQKACESGKSVRLVVQVPPETCREYTAPGQYVQVRLNENTKPLFLAMSSPPPSDAENSDPTTFEFLIKKTEGNDWIADAPAGTALQISQVLGSGFPLAENLEGFKYDFPAQNVLLFASGSGIAPIKAALESGVLGVGPNRLGRTARLYYGERTASDLCFVDKFAAWEAEGFEVVPVLSQPDDAWNGRSGYVQNALEEDGIAIPRNSGALLCGMKGMTEAVKDLLLRAGVFDGRVMLNF